MTSVIIITKFTIAPCQEELKRIGSQAKIRTKKKELADVQFAIQGSYIECNCLGKIILNITSLAKLSYIGVKRDC
jgi:hypothetical protein